MSSETRIPATIGWVAGGALLFAAASGAVAAYLQDFRLLFVPAAVLGALVAVPRVFRDPIPILVVFLAVVANLDAIKLGGGLTLDVVLSAVLLWSLVVRGSLRGRLLTGSVIERAFLVYLVAMFVSVVLSVDPATSLKRWGREAQYLVLFAFLLSRRLSEKEERWLVLAILLSSLGPCLTGFSAKFLGIETFAGSGVESEIEQSELIRIRGTMSHPVTLSLYVSMIALLTLSLLSRARPLSRVRYLGRLPLVGLSLLNLAALYLTYGRSGWAGFIAGLTGLLWFGGRRKWLFLGVPFVVFALFQFLPTLQERVVDVADTGDDSNSMLWRLRLWSYAIGFVPQRPIFGSGLGTFLEYVNFGHGFGPHQTWLGLLVETGVVGLASFVGLMVVVWRALRRAQRSLRPGSDPFLDGVVAGFIALLVGSIPAAAWSLPSVVVYFWALLAIALHPDRLARVRARAEVGP